MDGAVTREVAAALWRRHLEEAEAVSQQAWPRDITARMSEFEWLTLITEIIVPVRNELALGFEERRRQFEPASRDPVGGHGDGDGTGEQEETGELSVNQVYTVVLAAAAACNRWLKEGLGPGLRDGGQRVETPKTLDPAVDIDHWAMERARPMMEEPSGDDIERWLRWVDLRTARSLPEETATGEEWNQALGHSMTLVREAIHRLTLARLHMRAGDQALLEANVAAQITENVYRVVTWLAGTLQTWGIALVRLHNAVPEPDDGD
ncbi:MAG: hypothetical protein OXE17_00210 [Chloroflexi bacterium]|nr:hypothetical protein [Chloroflexota bacterium]